jgi:cysteine desulfurase
MRRTFVKSETNNPLPADQEGRPVYFDCNATTPLDERVADLMSRYLLVDYGNAGSRTHVYGLEAAKAVSRAREQVSTVLEAEPADVIFTSGATESNNLVILGLAEHGQSSGKRHIVSTQIEHKAVLEPLEALAKRGFEVTLVPPCKGGWVEPEAVIAAVRPDTLLVSVMHVNNETGVIQPLAEVAERLAGHDAFLHTDAAQGFGKELTALQHRRLDMISISGHKIHGPKGIGALLTRKRRFKRPPLSPLCFGGGQERGLRPGTIPVHLVVGLGLAAELAMSENQNRLAAAAQIKSALLEGLSSLRPVLHGDQRRALPTTLNLSIPGLDAEAAIVALKNLVAISNGSACTSAGHQLSHVLQAMALPAECVSGAMRWSWHHATPVPDRSAICRALQRLL